MKKIISVMLIVYLLLPMNVFSQDQEAGYADGMQDAAASVDGVTWILTGCVTGGFSYLYPSLFNPAVPQSRLVGKSPEYVANYTDGYNFKRKKIIQKNSLIGGGIYWGSCVIYVVVASLATASSTTATYAY